MPEIPVRQLAFGCKFQMNDAALRAATWNRFAAGVHQERPNRQDIACCRENAHRRAVGIGVATGLRAGNDLQRAVIGGRRIDGIAQSFHDLVDRPGVRNEGRSDQDMVARNAVRARTASL